MIPRTSLIQNLHNKICLRVNDIPFLNRGFNDLRILRIFFGFVDFQSIFQWKYPGGIKWRLLHTKKSSFL